MDGGGLILAARDAARRDAASQKEERERYKQGLDGLLDSLRGGPLKQGDEDIVAVASWLSSSDSPVFGSPSPAPHLSSTGRPPAHHRAQEPLGGADSDALVGRTRTCLFGGDRAAATCAKPRPSSAKPASRRAAATGGGSATAATTTPPPPRARRPASAGPRRRRPESAGPARVVRPQSASVKGRFGGAGGTLPAAEPEAGRRAAARAGAGRAAARLEAAVGGRPPVKGRLRSASTPTAAAVPAIALAANSKTFFSSTLSLPEPASGPSRAALDASMHAHRRHWLQLRPSTGLAVAAAVAGPAHSVHRSRGGGATILTKRPVASSETVSGRARDMFCSLHSSFCVSCHSRLCLTLRLALRLALRRFVGCLSRRSL